MKKIVYTVLLVFVFCTAAAYAGMLDNAIKAIGSPASKGADNGTGKGPDNDTAISGLKEALSIGTENAVKSVSQTDGYFKNKMIRILMPEKIQKVADVLSKVGYQKEVDDFILSMNRAAEKAAPQALSIFTDAVKEMTIPDAVKILHGNDTAATDFLRSKTYDRIYGAFKPVVSSAMNDVGVTHSFKQMMDKARTIPLLKREAVDLDHYVTSKALDGLFIVVGQEEKKIRKDPSARVTELLRTVFK